MQALKSIIKNHKFQIAILVLMAPVIAKIFYFINILGIYFGSFLRGISNCIG